MAPNGRVDARVSNRHSIESNTDNQLSTTVVNDLITIDCLRLPIKSLNSVSHSSKLNEPFQSNQLIQFIKSKFLNTNLFGSFCFEQKPGLSPLSMCPTPKNGPPSSIRNNRSELDQNRDLLITTIDDLIGLVDDPTTVYLLTKVKSEFDVLIKFAPKYDVMGLPANGYRTLVRLWSRVISTETDRLKKSNQVNNQLEVSQLIKLIRLFLKTCDSLRTNRLARDTNDNETLRLSMLDICRTMLDESVLQSTMSPNLIGILYSHDTKFLLKSFTKATAVRFSTSIIDKARCLFDSRLASDEAIKFGLNHDYEAYTKMFRMADSVPSKIVTCLFNCVYNRLWTRTSRDVTVNLKTEYEIYRQSVTEFKIRHNLNGNCRPLRFRLIRSEPSIDNDGQFERSLLMHLKGGGFMGPSAATYDLMYVRFVAETCPGLTIVVPDYTDAVDAPFPASLQDCIDFYRWCTSTDSSVSSSMSFDLIT